MATIAVEVIKDLTGLLAGQLDEIADRAVRKQVFVTEADVKTNIVKYDYIDTGNALGSVRGEMTGKAQGMVSVSAESESGYPYPTAGNYGTVHQAPRPFFSEAEAKARAEFGPRAKRELDAVLP